MRCRPTSMTHRWLAVIAVLSALALLVLPGCSSGGSTSAPAKASPSPPASQRYASKAFVVPLTVTVDASLKSPPNPDSSHLLFWDAANSSTDKVTFLVPAKVYLPDSSTPEAPPKDYLKWLQGFTQFGGKFSNVTKINVDGHPATLMTATSIYGELEDTLGCSSASADPSANDKVCFGVPDDLIKRIAVIPLGNTTLVAWARTSKAHPDMAFFAMFERMLKSVRFH
jgi:hypothetical protein